MEITEKKIKSLIMICLCVLLVESVLGFATLYTGILYREFDEKSAGEMLEIIKESDSNYYEKLIVEKDIEYLRQFQDRYTKRRNMPLIAFGIVMILFSFGGIAPIGMILINFNSNKKEAEGKSAEEDRTEKVDEDKREEEEREKKKI